ncbi:sulfurtransferase [Polaribacter batillariae]|uniref:Sulfurtransferase n=1 Tax=Polaribacter batillariae TaxID=2808900 RepID=A0ABX7SUG8_9FLAO|nr:sulfurtransferase [Polaribacter batillariae]QTD37884.1 sulfurtransferase [Polaribacter batillariae]
MSLKINSPLVSVDWLYNNLENENLTILDCTIPKVTNKSQNSTVKKQIKGAIFFDLKNIFSNKNSPLPNTVLSAKEFQEKAQELGIQKNAALVCYDDLGVYSSPRVWWMFQLMGFNNVAVLDGGLPAWKAKKHPIESPKNQQPKKGNFKVNYKPEKLIFTKDVLNSIEKKEVLIVDARSKGRFYGTEPEPRNDLKSGHIPNSVNLPFTEIQQNGKMKSKEVLEDIFKDYKNKKQIIFTCGSGITASILALGAEIAGVKNVAVYDGSWTEWGSTTNLPIAL